MERLRRHVRTELQGLAERWARWQLGRRGYLEFLNLRPPQAFPPIFADQWFLYRIVRRRKPNAVLEFGSGCSSAIIAQALWENKRDAGGSPRLLSIESDSYWAEANARAMPKHLTGLWEIRHIPVLETEAGGEPALRYARLPDFSPDFVYIDGPAFSGGRKFVSNIIEMEKRFRPGCVIVVDGRWYQVEFLKRHLRRRYRFRRSWLLKNSLFKLSE